MPFSRRRTNYLRRYTYERGRLLMMLYWCRQLLHLLLLLLLLLLLRLKLWNQLLELLYLMVGDFSGIFQLS